jgi:hypothetical protein
MTKEEMNVDKVTEGTDIHKCDKCDEPAKHFLSPPNKNSVAPALCEKHFTKYIEDLKRSFGIHR